MSKYFKRDDAVEAVQIAESEEALAALALLLGREKITVIRNANNPEDSPRVHVPTERGPAYPAVGEWVITTKVPGMFETCQNELFTANYIRFGK